MTCCEMIGCIANASGILFTVLGFCYAYHAYLKDKRDSERRFLAEQAIAYLCSEDAAVKEIAALTKESEKSIKTRLRDAAQKDEKNVGGKRPESIATKVQKYL